MKRPLIAFILSALTFFGGHYYNNKWVRASFFSTLMILWFLLYVPVIFLILIFVSEFVDIQSFVTNSTKVWTFGLGLIWLSSAIVAALDARRPSPDISEKGTFARWFSILGMCAIGVLVIISIPAIWLLQGEVKFSGHFESTSSGPIELVTEAPPITERKRYLGSVNTSFEDFDWSSRKILASGPGIIQGKVLVDDRACAGLKLRLFLSDELRSQWAKSDENGIYQIPVPFGRYRYQGWELDSDSADKVLAGKIMADYFDSREQIISVAEDSPGKGPDFYFIDPVVRIQPMGEVKLSDELMFEWEPYPEAAFYKIQIIDLGARPFHSLSHTWDPLFKWLNKPEVENTQVSISELGVVLKSGHNYTWQVEAYGEDGVMLSKTSDIYGAVFKVK